MRKVMRTVNLLTVLAVLTALAVPAIAGEVIDKTNCDKIKGMVPDSVMAWIQKGDMTITIVDKLDFDTGAIMKEPSFVAECDKNRGKYVLKEGFIVDAATGNSAGFIAGLPFPDPIDAKDPDAFYKLNYNRYYNLHRIGSIRFVFLGELISRNGLEKKVTGNFLNYSYDGYPPQRDTPNDDDIKFMSINNITFPYDMKGVASMMWRYRENKPDMCYNYLPGIRRVRRGSPAGRSDSFAGSELTLDDQGGYQGKISAMNMRVVEEKVALVPWVDTKPVPVQPNDKGEWVTGKDAPKLQIGYRLGDKWNGAPWAMPGLKYVKRTVLVGEMVAKDPSYNYGVSTMWCDKETGMACYKVNYDRKKEYWKTMILGLAAFGAKDDPQKRWFEMGSTLIVDDRADRATIIEQVTPDHPYVFYANNPRNDFSLGGFGKYCK